MKFQVKEGGPNSGAVRKFGFKGKNYFQGDIIDVSNAEDIATLRRASHIVKELTEKKTTKKTKTKPKAPKTETKPQEEPKEAPKSEETPKKIPVPEPEPFTVEGPTGSTEL
jgi:outer membrane biosynthesis protein TonB